MAQRLGYIVSDETKKKISEARRGKNFISLKGRASIVASKQKRVQLGDKVYNSISEVAKVLGMSPNRVSRAINKNYSITLKFIE